MNAGPARIWKGAVVTCSRVLPQYSAGEAEGNEKSADKEINCILSGC